MSIRKIIKHYGKLGGRHQDRTKDEEPLDPTIELGIRTCPQCHKSQFEYESYMGSIGPVERHHCIYCGWVFTHREGADQ